MNLQFSELIENLPSLNINEKTEVESLAYFVNDNYTHIEILQEEDNFLLRNYIYDYGKSERVLFSSYYFYVKPYRGKHLISRLEEKDIKVINNKLFGVLSYDKVYDKGDIAGFPIVILELMLVRSQEQGTNSREAIINLEISRTSSRGFTWETSIEGHNFWEEVINSRKFNVFFEKYPELSENTVITTKQLKEYYE